MKRDASRHVWPVVILLVVFTAWPVRVEGEDGNSNPFPCFLCYLSSDDPFVGELKQAGFETDNASLIRSLRGRATPHDRILMIRLLVLRNERQAEPAFLEVLERQEELSLPRAYLRLLEVNPLWRGHYEFELRRESAIGLVELGNATGLIVLRELVHSIEDWARQLQVASDLAKIRDPSGYRYLAAASKSEAPARRRASIDGLSWSAAFDGKIFEGVRVDAVNKLSGLATDESPWIRWLFLGQVISAAERDVNPWVYREAVKDMADNDPEKEIRKRAKFLLRRGVLRRAGSANEP